MTVSNQSAQAKAQEARNTSRMLQIALFDFN